jgi:glycosyltransferase involved in cell wall biosynthesis
VPARSTRPLRVTHLVLSATFAGVERSVVDVASELDARGHEVRVIGDPAAFGAHVGGPRTVFRPARSVREAMRVLREGDAPDLVHVHMTAAELAATLAFPTRRVPIVATRHFAARRGASALGHLAAPVIRRRVDAQIAISRFVADTVGEPTTVLLNGVRVPATVGSDRRPVVLVAQRLDAEKRTGDALDAWARSGLAAKGWSLRIAGDGGERASLERRARDLGLEGVSFLGHRRDVDRLRSEASIVLATPSSEPFGLTVAEAMAAGVPVVAARGGGHLETVGAARPDLLYPPGDADECAALLRRLADDPDLRDRAGADLRAFAAEHLSLERHVDRLEEVYASVTAPATRADGALDVLRVFHGGVVDAWRARERRLAERNCRVRLVTARRWNEGGRDVPFVANGDSFATAARTVGRHPYVFLYDPRPIARELRRPLDLVDVHEEPASLAALEVRLLRRLARQPAPLVFYGAQNIEKRYPVPFRWIERGSLRAASGAYCCNADALAVFRRKGFTGVGTVIGLGVDVERFTDDRTPATGDDRTVRVGFVGRIEERKGVGVLLDAVRDLEGVRLDLYGDGPDRARFEGMATRLGIADRVTFHGFTPETDLPAVYRRLDLLAVPSLRTPTWVEQFGRVAVEAMAAGVPVVASDDGALREVVDGAGRLVAPADVAAWRDAIAELAASADQRRRLADLGLARAREYSWDTVAERQRAFYDEVVG